MSRAMEKKPSFFQIKSQKLSEAAVLIKTKFCKKKNNKKNHQTYLNVA